MTTKHALPMLPIAGALLLGTCSVWAIDITGLQPNLIQRPGEHVNIVGTLTVPPFDGTSGGTLRIEAKSITVNGIIDLTGKGYGGGGGGGGGGGADGGDPGSRGGRGASGNGNTSQAGQGANGSTNNSVQALGGDGGSGARGQSDVTR